jgi:hypothetical protein
MNTITFGKEYLTELKAEAGATRKCLQRVPDNLFDWKPHEKSMTLGYLSLLVAEIPKWITHMVIKSELDFATFEHYKPKTTEELVRHFDANLKGALEVLREVSNEDLDQPFYLKNQG